MAAEGELDLDAKMKYKITAIEKRKEMREENISKVLNIKENTVQTRRTCLN